MHQVLPRCNQILLDAAHLAFRPLRRVKVGGATAGVRMPLHIRRCWEGQVFVVKAQSTGQTNAFS